MVNYHPYLFVLLFARCCMFLLYSMRDHYHWLAGMQFKQGHIFRWLYLDMDLISLIPPHTHLTWVWTLDSDWQGAKVPQTYIERYNICKCRSYGLSVELHPWPLALVVISRKITQKMSSPPMIPHDVQVKQKEGQAILMWTIGALVDLLNLEWYLKIKWPSTASVSLYGNGHYAFPKNMSASGSNR